MPQVLQAHELLLSEVEDKFDLREVLGEPDFFLEWQSALPGLTETEQQNLDRIRTEFLYLSKYRMLEDLVKMVMISPLLSMAGFYRPPIRPVLEKRVDVSLADGDQTVWGRIDILGLQQQLWVAVIESKQAGFSLKDAIAQTLFYMCANPSIDRPTFALVCNGSHFRFIKLEAGNPSRYGLSIELSIHRSENELYQVLAVLKRFVALAV
jgi:hypothetical protein